MATLAAELLHQLDSVHAHPAIDRLAHVVNGEQADVHRGQRFHLDPGTADCFRGDGAADGAFRLVELELHRHAGERDRVAERDQLAGALGGLDRGDARDAEHVALLRAAGFHHREGVGEHHDAAGGDRHAAAFGLCADVDHVGLAVGVEVGQRAGVLCGHGASAGRRPMSLRAVRPPTRAVKHTDTSSRGTGSDRRVS